ncbi:MAG: hypothetical protein OXT69_00930 [Candidatus Poribacteria bacterium]|nr:hypothetical protein [Candidatus Poribacteria bacterium]
MKKTILIIMVLLTAAWAISANAQIYFEDDFSNVNESEKKWVDLWGTWEFNGGEYRQTSGEANAMSVVADDYWDEGWVEYTYEVRGKKTGGAEGFLIMFRCQGMMEPRGKPLRDHPPRMTEQERLEYWWNLGGWGNTRSQIEAWGGGTAGAHSNHTIATNEWYEIRIENRADGYTLYLNDEMVAEMADATRGGVGRIGVATWITQASYDDVMVYGPAGALSVDPSGKSAAMWGSLKEDRR